MLNINILPEYVVSILGFPVSNTLLTSVLVSFFLMFWAYIFSRQTSDENTFPVRLLKVIITELLTFIEDIIGDWELSKKILPLISTLFLFILTANLMELIPGFLGSFFVENNLYKVSLLRSPDSDLNTTVALALFSAVSVQTVSINVLGWGGYIRRFFNFSSPITFILGFFELLSEGVKVLSFSFRLFGNIFAGEVLLLIIAFLAPYFIPVPFMILEVFVGAIQAFIFSVLTLTFIKTSTINKKAA